MILTSDILAKVFFPEETRPMVSLQVWPSSDLRSARRAFISYGKLAIGKRDNYSASVLNGFAFEAFLDSIGPSSPLTRVTLARTRSRMLLDGAARWNAMKLGRGKVSHVRVRRWPRGGVKRLWIVQIRRHLKARRRRFFLHAQSIVVGCDIT